MSLIEIIEQYQYDLRFHNKEVANKFLQDTVEPALHKHIQGTFNDLNDLARADGSSFYWKK